MNYLAELRAFLQGRKTYLVVIAAVVSALAAWSNGAITDIELVRSLYEALAASTIRAGISSQGVKP